MGELINGRTPEEIKRWLRWATYRCIQTEDRCATCEYRDDCGEYCGSDTYKEALAYIDRLEVALKCEQIARDVLMEDIPKWISVEERFPEYKTAVLGYGLRESVHGNIDPFPAEHIVYTKGEGEGWFTFWNKEYVKVTHWMPLPQPPEEDKHG